MEGWEGLHLFMHDCMKGQNDVVVLLSKPAKNPKTLNLISRFKTLLLFADAIALHCIATCPTQSVLSSICCYQMHFGLWFSLSDPLYMVN